MEDQKRQNEGRIVDVDFTVYIMIYSGIIDGNHNSTACDFWYSTEMMHLILLLNVFARKKNEEEHQETGNQHGLDAAPGRFG